MKTIGIINSADIDTAVLKSKIDIISVKSIAGSQFSLGKMAGKNVIVARCNTGKVNAAICAQILIDLYGVDCIISTGIACAVKEGLVAGDVAISLDLAHHDFDTTGIGDALYVNSSIGDSFFCADSRLVKVANAVCSHVAGKDRCHTGRITTGDQFVMSKEVKDRIGRDLDSLCIDMEGAAIGQACYLNNMPFVVLRLICGEVGFGYEEFVGQASEMSAQILEGMLHGLC